MSHNTKMQKLFRCTSGCEFRSRWARHYVQHDHSADLQLFQEHKMSHGRWMWLTFPAAMMLAMPACDGVFTVQLLITLQQQCKHNRKQLPVIRHLPTTTTGNISTFPNQIRLLQAEHWQPSPEHCLHHASAKALSWSSTSWKPYCSSCTHKGTGKDVVNAC